MLFRGSSEILKDFFMYSEKDEIIKSFPNSERTFIDQDSVINGNCHFVIGTGKT